MSQQVLEPLSQDEQTVLGILNEGGSVAPIGRWEKSVNSLGRKGLAKIDNPANSSITQSGRLALSAADDDRFETIAKHLIEASKSHVAIQSFIDQAARALKSAAEESARITGDTPRITLEKWGKVLIDRAMELLA